VRRRPLAAGLLFIGACAHTDAAAGKRGIYLDCDVQQANVFVDDYYLQHALNWRAKPMALRPGMHRIEVVADGYYNYYGEVTVGEQGFQTIVVRLRKTLD
jgi:hypothetical protein